MTKPDARPPTVGLTGGIASGKSTFGRLLAAHGLAVVDADHLVAELYRPGAAGAAVVAELFGPSALEANGSVNRAVVAAQIFQNPEARRGLEAAIHPLVRQRFFELAATSPEPAVFEASQLIETGMASQFDWIITVEADEELRLHRAVARGMEEADARARMKAQATESERIAAADRVVRNEGSLEDLEAIAAELAREIRSEPPPRRGDD